MIATIKKFSASHRIIYNLVIAVLIISALLVAARIALSPGIIYGANRWLLQQGITSTIEAVNINFTDGSVSLVNARGFKQDQPLYSIGLVEIHWQWKPLQKRTIKVTKVVLDGLRLDINKYSDSITIGGVNLAMKAGASNGEIAEAPAEQKPAKAWAAALGDVVFTNLNLCYSQYEQTKQNASSTTAQLDYCATLEEMHWGGTISYADESITFAEDDLPLASKGDFILNGLRLKDNRLDRHLLISESNQLKQVSIHGLNDIKIDQMVMNELSLLQRDDVKHKDAVRFSQLQVDAIEINSLSQLNIDSISVKQPGLYIVKRADNSWEYQQWLPQAVAKAETAAEPTAEIKATDKTDNAVKFSLRSLNIENSDLCFQNNAIDVYYCLTIADLYWLGNIAYNSAPDKAQATNLDIKGDLQVDTLAINNQTIQRLLLGFSQLNLNQLAVTGAEDIHLDKLQLKQLSALQRGEDPKDNTAAFSTLDINALSLEDNELTIDNIELAGLTNTVSKNKDGSWEHDKWMSQQQSLIKQDDGNTPAPAGGETKPLAINIKRVAVTSDDKILFYDNSTSPVMKVGLQKLEAEVLSLVSDSPDSNSNFTLHAQTIKHSTIDLAGSAKPFAEKLSFDAEGKLRGFDLRAASPATIKAIGHKIQSGQLDADLKLLAVDDILDSNVSLSLYHFRIKPESKEDAAALDEKFGMPLDQTLVLLREKDDSIHLDIPITGNVNEPNFDPMDAIIQATSKAATVTLITFYTPYGLIYAGGNIAFNLATALNFDPVEFEPGAAELSADDRRQLDELSKLMTEKPQVHLTLCGITSQKDLFALFPDAKEKITAAEADKTIRPDEAQLSKLTQLARDRQVNSKNYLIKQHGISHDRLILCAPEHRDGEDEFSGVEINI